MNEIYTRHNHSQIDIQTVLSPAKKPPAMARGANCRGLALLRLLFLSESACVAVPTGPLRVIGRMPAAPVIMAHETGVAAVGMGAVAVADDAERWLKRVQQRARGVKCPFWRRRFGDMIDGALTVARFVAARHKSWEIPVDIALLTPAGTAGSSRPKRRGLSMAELQAILHDDLVERQYYVTGRLSSCVYADRCLFDGPDPDMPVRDVQRYSDALRGLFDPSSSRIDLIELRQHGDRSFIADWRLEGALQLPWHPAIKPFTGSTLYELDEEGLICSHTETWSISALDAFVSVFFPSWGAAPAESVEQLRLARGLQL
jgi:hypothetical protein